MLCLETFADFHPHSLAGVALETANKMKRRVIISKITAFSEFELFAHIKYTI